MKRITIAIDGFSSCGKSTLAKALAIELNYGYVDTGAMYRATTLYFLQNNIDLENEEEIKNALCHINISFKAEDGKNCTYLNGKNVEEEIRGMKVSGMVSPVATISTVRRSMVAQQREMGKEKGVVMDGRDVGTVVFPNAELKIFLTAEMETRARRRYDELKSKNQIVSFESINENLKERDRIDSTREDSPLRKAEDAIEIDNTNLTKEEQVNLGMKLVMELLNKEIM